MRRELEILLFVAIGAFGVGLPIILGRLASLPPPVDSGEIAMRGTNSTWFEASIGTRLKIPSVDSFGTTGALHGSQLLLVLSCNECVRDPVEASDYVWNSEPASTLVVFDGDVDAVPASFHVNKTCLAFAGRDGEFVPLEWRLRSPQAFLLRDGTVVEVPRSGESLDQYVLRLRQRNLAEVASGH